MLNSCSLILDLRDCERGRISPRHDNIKFFVVVFFRTHPRESLGAGAKVVESLAQKLSNQGLVKRNYSHGE